MILRCQGCRDWRRFHDDDLEESRVSDELATFIPAHQFCGGQIDVAVLPAQRHEARVTRTAETARAVPSPRG